MTQQKLLLIIISEDNTIAKQRKNTPIYFIKNVHAYKHYDDPFETC